MTSLQLRGYGHFVLAVILPSNADSAADAEVIVADVPAVATDVSDVIADT
jgi:hypothetical protein